MAALGFFIRKKSPDIIPDLPPVGGGVTGDDDEILYPKPNTIPELRPYEVDKTHDLWHAKNPESYITPDNEWVRYYASQLFIDDDGRIKYKYKTVPLLKDKQGNVLQYDYKPFVNNYTFDIYSMFFETVDRNNIPWLMPDFYLFYDQKGVCSAWANAVTSMMLSGEMSLWQDRKFVKQVIPAQAVLGYVGLGRDEWVEYQVYGKTWLTSTSLILNSITHEQTSSTIFIERTPEFKAVLRFSDSFNSAV